MKKKLNYLTDRVLAALKSVLVKDVGAIHEPFFIGKEREYLNSCIDSTYVSSVGAFVGEFESKLTQYTNSKHAIAVVNGTSALHIALKVVGVKPNDEVLVPAMTFIGTANAVSYCGATPHLVEIEEKTLGIDVPKLRHYLKSVVINRNDLSINKKTGNIISAIIPMHAYGHPTELDQLKELCDEFHLHMVEDAAESLGSIYKGKHTGTVGDLGIISFNGNKTITTGGGGVILTNDEELASKARHLTTTARIQHEWKMIHDEVGYNYRMPNINAALGCAQMEYIEKIIEYKRKLYQKYKTAFLGIEDVRLVEEPSNCRSNYWLQTIILNARYKKERDHILNITNYLKIPTRAAFTPLNQLTPYSTCPTMKTPCSDDVASRIINIPSGARLAYEEK